LQEGGQEASLSERQKLASGQPFAIFCALHEMLPCKDIKGVSAKEESLRPTL